MSYPLPYHGNKYKETKYILDIFDLSDYKYIVEPFGGIFGFSRAISEINKKCTFLINDYDSELIKIHKYFQKTKNLKKFVTTCKNIIGSIKAKTDFEFASKIKKSKKNDMAHIFLKKYIIHAFYVNSKKKLINSLNNLENTIENIRDTLNRCVFYNMDYNQFINMIKKKKLKKVLFFFDPPYFDSHNFSYSYTKNITKKIKDNSEMYIDILDFFEENKYDCILVLNHIKIIDFLFQDYYISSYNKIYQKTKKETEHVIYSNIT